MTAPTVDRDALFSIPSNYATPEDALEATLSFLGLGLPITEPSLGLLIANGFDYMLSGRYWISLFPGIALIVTIYAINLAGDRMRDVLNPRLAK